MAATRAGFIVAVAFCLAACQSLPASRDRPARLVNPDAETRAALQVAVDSALGTRVTLSETALTDGSLLTIEHWPRPTLGNSVPQGRILQMPLQFRLVINRGQCILVSEDDQSRHVLLDAECVAEQARRTQQWNETAVPRS